MGDEGGESPSMISFSFILGEGISGVVSEVVLVVGLAGESRERYLIPSVRSVAMSGERGLGAEISASSSCRQGNGRFSEDRIMLSLLFFRPLSSCPTLDCMRGSP